MDLRDMIYYKTAVWDGNNLAWRYMKKPFLFWSHNGRKTGVIHGVLNSVLALKRRYKVKNIYVCWDHTVNKRKAVNESYKANRESGRYTDSNELGKQIETLHNNLKRFGILSLKEEGYEADDLCYSAVRKFSKNLDRSERILLISKDHDFEQIISSVGVDKVNLLVPGSGTKPDIIIDEPLGYSFGVYHALTGDSADNIKGIFRFPKKKAVELASKYESVEAMLKYESDSKIQENAKMLFENECQLSNEYFSEISTRTPKPDFEAIREFLEYYGLKKITETFYGKERQVEIFGEMV